MRVLHVCETIKGGIATYLNTMDQVCGDVVDGVQVVPEGHVDQLAPGARHVAYRRDRRGITGLINLARASYREIRRCRPDFIFFHSSFSALLMPVFRLLRVPGIFIYCPHAWARLAYSERRLLGRAISAVEGRLSGFSDVVLNISKNDRALALKHGYRGDHRLVENALADVPDQDLRSPFATGEGRINLLFVGRFDRQKGLDMLLDAFKLAANSNPSLHLHVVGAAVYDTDLATDAPGMTFHPWVPFSQIPAYFSSADLVVLPSRWEGLPMVLIEALRAGTPVMVADRCGLGELIVDGRSGFAIRPDTESFAEALAGLTRFQLGEMRQSARAQYERRYGPERFRKEMLELLGELYRAHQVRRQESTAPEL